MQAGSSVDADRLRFDFTHDRALTAADIKAVEEWVNAGIAQDAPVECFEVEASSGVAQGALAMFDEKYGDVVRVVQMPGLSTELCGGTHAASSSALHPFHIVSESAVAAGTRRIEGSHRTLHAVAEALGGSPQQAWDRAQAATSARKDLQKQVKALQQRVAERPPAPLARVAGEAFGGPIELHAVDSVEEDPQVVKKRAQWLTKQSKDAAHIIVSTSGQVVCAMPKKWPGTAAKDLIRLLLTEVGDNAKGGGSAVFAQGNVGHGEKSKEIVREWLQGK